MTSLLLATLILWVCFSTGCHAMIVRSDTNTTPSYDEVMAHSEDRINTIYASYPERSNITGLFLSPKGSRVVEHEYVDIWTVETEVVIWVTVETLKRLDVENQNLELVVEETFIWTDEHFVLDGTTEDEMIEIDQKKIWTPEILPDGVHEEVTLSEPSTVRVSLNNGRCYQTRQKMYTVPCKVNVQPFPFDIHNCSLRLFQKQRYNTRMKFVSLIQPRDREMEKDNQLVLITSSSAASSLLSNSGTLDWVIRDFNMSVLKRTRSNNDYFYTDEFKLDLVLNRRSVFYATVLIFPCLLLNLLSFVIFTLPLKDTERENFAVTLILTYFVLIMMVVDASPSSGSDLPLLGLYIILSMCIVLVNFIVSLALIEVHEHCRERNARMPTWLARCLNCSLIVKAFTNKRHFKQDDNGNDASPNGANEEQAILRKSDQKGKKVKRCIAKAKDEYKWKVFCKVLNFLFFVLSIIANIVLGIVMYCKLPDLDHAL